MRKWLIPGVIAAVQFWGGCFEAQAEVVGAYCNSTESSLEGPCPAGDSSGYMPCHPANPTVDQKLALCVDCNGDGIFHLIRPEYACEDGYVVQAPTPARSKGAKPKTWFKVWLSWAD